MLEWCVSVTYTGWSVCKRSWCRVRRICKYYIKQLPKPLQDGENASKIRVMGLKRQGRFLSADMQKVPMSEMYCSVFSTFPTLIPIQCGLGCVAKCAARFRLAGDSRSGTELLCQMSLAWNAFDSICSFQKFFKRTPSEFLRSRESV